MSLSALPTHAPVADDFARVNHIIHEQLASGVTLIETIGHYIVDSGGKRVRPLLVLLAARALGYEGDRHTLLAALIEFMHTSTLLHDDVVDESSMRRGKATANETWGNAPSVLVGDFLYSRSFEMMVDVGSMPIMAVLSHATSTIAEGEVLQLTNIGNADISEEDYYRTIRGKTAMLFEASAHTGAMLTSAPDAHKEALRMFGQELGMAFQLIDDYLDYAGNATEMGKNVGDDLAEGKPTLPLLQAMKQGTPEEALLVRHAIEKGDGMAHLDDILRIVRDTGALEYTRQQAQERIQRALSALNIIPESPFKESLTLLAKQAVERSV